MEDNKLDQAAGYGDDAINADGGALPIDASAATGADVGQEPTEEQKEELEQFVEALLGSEAPVADGEGVSDGSEIADDGDQGDLSDDGGLEIGDDTTASDSDAPAQGDAQDPNADETSANQDDNAGCMG